MVLRPVGRLPARVYWRRRLVLVAALAVIVVIAVRACGGASAGRTPASPQPTAAEACADGQLHASVISIRSGSRSGLRFVGRVVNQGLSPCQLIAGSADIVWTVRTGGVKVWSDAGCQRPSSGLNAVLPPGGPAKTLTHSWNGRQGSRCGHGGTPATPGTYTVTLRVGSSVSPPKPFRLVTASPTPSPATS